MSPFEYYSFEYYFVAHTVLNILYTACGVVFKVLVWKPTRPIHKLSSLHMIN